MTIYDLLYYIVGGLSFAAVVLSKRVPLFSFSGIHLVLCFLFLYIPGYINYRGGVLFNNDGAINVLVLSLFLYQIVSSALCSMLVWVRNCGKITPVPRGMIFITYSMITIIVLAYCVSYFIYFSVDLPLLQLLNGDFLATAQSRVNLTHGFDGGAYPLIFSWYRPISKDLLLFLLLPLVLYKYALNNEFSLLFKTFVFLFLIFSLLAHLEKAYVLILCLILYIAYNNFKNTGILRTLSFLLLIISAAVLTTYLLFSPTLESAILYLPQRLAAQVGYVPEQLSIASKDIPLWTKGINFGMVGKNFGLHYIDISKVAWESVHSELVRLGFTGSSAGSAVAESYIIFGYLGLFLYPIVAISHYKIDKILWTSVVSLDQVKFSSLIFYSVYLYYIGMYSMALLGTAFGMITFPYVFQPGMVLVCVVIISVYRIRYISNPIFTKNN